MATYRLRSGDLVTSKDGKWPTQYTNRTQAERAAAKIEGAEVIVRGRPFYVRVPETDECPKCEKVAVLSDARIGAISFTEPVCEACRSDIERELSMDSFDIAYERERARGWAD